MKPRQYLEFVECKLGTLKAKYKQEKDRHETNKLRQRFNTTPSTKLFERREETELDPGRTEEYFRKVLAPFHDQETKPIFDKHICRVQKWAAKQNCKLSGELIKELAQKLIAKASPWKSPGEDNIPNYLYKIRTSAEKYLIETVTRELQGEVTLGEDDVRAQLILLYKKGDAQDPADYRPILLLNSDYKIITGTIACYLQSQVTNKVYYL